MTKATSQVKKISDCKREVELEIPAEDVGKELEEVIAQFATKARIKGFRQGKAPREIVKLKYYPEIKESVIDSLIPKALEEKLSASGLHPVASPVVSDLFFEEGKPLRFKAQFEIWSDFPLPEYKNIQMKKRTVSVTDQEVEESLKQLQARSAQYLPVEGRGVASGDYVLVALSRKDLRSKKAFPLERVIILAGHPENEEALDQNLPGLKPGGERSFVISYKEDHPDKKLAGKEIEYHLKVLSIKEKKLPEMNDDFAKDLGNYQNLAELKDHIRTELQASHEKSIRKEMVEEIMGKISANLDFEVPESIVEQETWNDLRRLLSRYPRGSLQKEDAEKLKLETKKKAEQKVKERLLLVKIAEKENLSISEEEVSEELRAIAQENNLPLARVAETVDKEDRREELRNTLLLKKTVDFLINHAIIS